ncbi:uncharacterized protein [Hyperolius riggenbachi]|uniref:uncharacterized protein n=1 Tax=Hyperolius riggenbachi TaxID=752182 RepID=UPI0035A3727C
MDVNEEKKVNVDEETTIPYDLNKVLLPLFTVPCHLLTVEFAYGSFYVLLDLVRSDLTEGHTNFRQSISAEEKLLIPCNRPIIFLPAFFFRLGMSTISYIVHDTCRAIWLRVAPRHLRPPEEANWQEIANLFWEKTKFPNCLGAIDGKHIRRVMPPFSGSNYFNYKKYFSLVLIAIADAKSRFIYIDVGSYGSSGDSFIFQHSNFYRNMMNDSLNFPAPTPWPGTTGPPWPFTLIGDEAFGLSQHLMRPFASRYLSVDCRNRTMFNFRLSRAKQVEECAFGVLANKWQVLHTSINLNVSNAISVVKATYVLHNSVLDLEGVSPDVSDVCHLRDVRANPPRASRQRRAQRAADAPPQQPDQQQGQQQAQQQAQQQHVWQRNAIIEDSSSEGDE